MLIGAVPFADAPIGEIVGEFTGQPVYFRSLRIAVGRRRFGSRRAGISEGRELGEMAAGHAGGSGEHFQSSEMGNVRGFAFLSVVSSQWDWLILLQLTTD